MAKSFLCCGLILGAIAVLLVIYSQLDIGVTGPSIDAPAAAEQATDQKEKLKSLGYLN